MPQRRTNPEEAIHIACADLLRYHEAQGRLTFYHPPNGGRRGKREAAIFARMGVRAGVPDLVILFPDASTAFVEVKATQGALSPAQVQWSKLLEGWGFRWAVVRDVLELRAILDAWLAEIGPRVDSDDDLGVAGDSEEITPEAFPANDLGWPGRR